MCINEIIDNLEDKPKVEICMHYDESRNQRKAELARGLSESKTGRYEKCLVCDGFKTDCSDFANDATNFARIEYLNKQKANQ